MTDRQLLKEARDLLLLCSLIDKSGQCETMVNEIDKHIGQSEQFYCSSSEDEKERCKIQCSECAGLEEQVKQ